MLFQQQFQNADVPEEKHTTFAVYHTGADGKYPYLHSTPGISQECECA